MSRIVVIDVPAESGGALTVLSTYYKQALVDTKDTWLFIVSTPILNNTSNIKVVNFPWVKKSWVHRLYFDIFVAHRVINQFRAGKIISLQNTIVPFSKQPTDIYLHQSLPFAKKRYSLTENPRFWVYQNIISRYIVRSVKRANKITVQTQWIADALVSTVGIRKTQIQVIKPSLPNPILTKYKPINIGDMQRFIYPTAPYEYKNIGVIVEALKLLRHNGIVNYVVEFTFSPHANKLAERIYSESKKFDLPIKFIGTIEYTKLCKKYTDSVLVFPSKLETFGMPLLEARTCHSPIIASNEVFCREVLDGYSHANFFEADDAFALASLMAEQIHDRNGQASKQIVTPLNILFIGGMYSTSMYNDYLRDSPRGLQGAVNVHQWNIINGLKSADGVSICQLSAPYLATYPGYNKLIVKAVNEPRFQSIGYLNLPYIKDILRSTFLKIRTTKWLRNKDVSGSKAVICYYVSIPQMQAALSVGPDIHKTLVIADVPDYLNLSKNVKMLERVKNRLKVRKIRKLIRKFDSFVVVTKYIAELLKLPAGSWIVSEGMVSADQISDTDAIKNREYINNDVVYAGSLHEKYGVRDLLNAAVGLEGKNIDFYFYGSGEMAEELKLADSTYGHIHFMGFAHHDTVLAHQLRAKLLINPRRNEHDYIRYSFPSKNLEYLASGTPVLCYKIDSIPNEYDDVFTYVEERSPDALQAAILSIMRQNITALRERSLKAIEFVSQHKTNTLQTARILDFINERRRQSSDVSSSKITHTSAFVDAIRKNILISILSLYLFSTFTLYIFGPFEYQNHHLFMLAVIVIFNILMIPLGYAAASSVYKRKIERPSNNRNQVVMSSRRLQVAIAIFCIFGSASIFIQIIALIGANDGIDLARQIINSIQNPANAYEMFVANHQASNAWALGISRISALLAPLTYFSLVVGLYSYSKLSLWQKFAVVAYVISLVLSTLITGQNIGIFNVAIVFVSILVLKLSQRRAFYHRKNARALSVFVLVAMIAIGYFSVSTLGRLGASEPLQSFSGVRVNDNNLMLQLSPKPLKNTVIMGTFYVSSGYKAVDYAFDYPFTSTFGLGNGYFSLNANRAVTGMDIFPRTYVAKMSGYWHPTINWHTAFVWFANDVSFWGLPIIIFLIGFLFCFIYRLARIGNIFAIAVFPLYLSMILFLPCNNLVLGNPSSAVAFVVLTILAFVYQTTKGSTFLSWLSREKA